MRRLDPHQISPSDTPGDVLQTIGEQTAWAEAPAGGGGGSGAGPGDPFAPGFRAGRWYESQVSREYSAGATVAGLVVYAPLWVPNATTFDAVAIEVTTAAAGSQMVVGLYADANGVPGTRHATVGAAFATTSTGIKQQTGLAVSVPTPGLYWIGALVTGGAPAVRSQSNTTVAAGGVHLHLGFDAALATGNPATGWNQAGQAALPLSVDPAGLVAGNSRYRVNLRAA